MRLIQPFDLCLRRGLTPQCLQDADTALGRSFPCDGGVHAQNDKHFVVLQIGTRAHAASPSLILDPTEYGAVVDVPLACAVLPRSGHRFAGARAINEEGSLLLVFPEQPARLHRGDQSSAGESPRVGHVDQFRAKLPQGVTAR